MDGDERRTLHVDYVMSTLNQDAYAVVQCLTHLIAQEWFPHAPRLSVWCDTGRHFQNGELAYYLLQTLPKAGKSVMLNYFGEKHGKNGRDAHFGVVSSHLAEVSLSQEILTAPARQS